MVKEVTPEQLENLLAEDENVIAIDVRENEEVAQGIIPKARHIPLNELPDYTSELDKSKEYVMVCRSGKRSHNATAFLNEHGFKASNMVGGMLEWHGETI